MGEWIHGHGKYEKPSHKFISPKMKIDTKTV